MTTLKDFLSAKRRRIWGVTPHARLGEVLKLMVLKSIDAVPVIDGDKVIGIVSERDLARKAVSMKRITMRASIRNFMDSKVHHVHPHTSMDRCMAIMDAHHVRHLPVLKNGKIIGMITLEDLAEHATREHKLILRKLLDSMEEGKNTLRTNVAFRLEQHILPLVRQLAQKHPRDHAVFHLLETLLKEISSASFWKYSSTTYNFTPTENSVIKLIRAKYREKEISETLNIALSTVKKHKYAIRGKLGIRNKSGNISRYLDNIV